MAPRTKAETARTGSGGMQRSTTTSSRPPTNVIEALAAPSAEISGRNPQADPSAAARMTGNRVGEKG